MKHASLIFYLVTGLILVSGFGYWTYAQHQAKAPSNINSANSAAPSFVTYHSRDLRLTFSYPQNWTLDESSAKLGQISVRSVAVLDINAIDSTGQVVIMVRPNNPSRLSPKEWYDKNLAGQTESSESPHEITVGRYPAYSLVADEMQKRQHIFMMAGTRVVELAFPADQPADNAIYQEILQSVQIET